MAQFLPPCDCLFKILLLGDCSVGKTCLVKQFTENNFSDQYVSTMGVDFGVHLVTLDGKRIKLQIWDTTGQKRFRSMITSFCRGASGIIIVYDVTNEESFSNLTLWLREIDQQPTRPNVSKLLVGNKCDMVDKKMVDYITAKKFADQVQIPLREVSAKGSSLCVEHAFMSLVLEIMQVQGTAADLYRNCTLLRDRPTTQSSERKKGCSNN